VFVHAGGVHVHENFLSLEKEKRDKIINAALREFAVNGFQKASTNEIAKNAGITKSLLFYYFSSKQELFEFLFHYSVKFLIEAIWSSPDRMPSDLFERYLVIAAIKLKIAAQYPDMYDFVQYAVKDQDNEFKNFFNSDEYLHISEEFRKKLHEGIDLSKFKPDIDTSKALQIIWWVIESFALAKQKEAAELNILRDDEFVNQMMNEVREYLQVLKTAFYKEEFLYDCMEIN
jgi:AcrR family transcriptional regulator